jgi:hypothetical protein
MKIVTKTVYERLIDALKEAYRKGEEIKYIEITRTEYQQLKKVDSSLFVETLPTEEGLLEGIRKTLCGYPFKVTD